MGSTFTLCALDAMKLQPPTQIGIAVISAKKQNCRHTASVHDTPVNHYMNVTLERNAKGNGTNINHAWLSGIQVYIVDKLSIGTVNL